MGKTAFTRMLWSARCWDWVTAVFARRLPKAEPEACRAAAMQLIATLEGGLILARSLDDPQDFDAVTHGISLDI